MAYGRRVNPDALPAFAEPDRPNAKPSSGGAASRPDAPPPAPVQSLRDDRPPASPSYNSSSSKYSDPRDRDYDRRYPSDSGGGGGRGGRNNSYESSGAGYRGDYRDRDRDRERDRESDRERDRRERDRERDRRDREKEYERSYRPAPGSAQQPPLPGQGGPSGRAPRDGNDRDALWPMFKAVDRDQSGQLSEAELGKALVNGDYTSFDPHTVKMMIRMFDVDRSGTISFDEFCGLWGFLTEWRKLFDRFDVDASGTISFDEFTAALVAFGYRLSNDYITLLFNTYDVKRRGVLSFDLFVQSCISLKRMTDVFKKYDTDRDGYITLSFEQFLTGSQSLFLFNSISPSTDKGLY